MTDEPRLIDYPYVLVRVSCRFCRRRGQYRLARIAAKWGAEISLEEVLDRIAYGCPWPRPSQVRKQRKHQGFCGIMLIDLERSPPRPPDMPPAAAGLRLVASDDDAA